MIFISKKRENKEKKKVNDEDEGFFIYDNVICSGNSYSDLDADVMIETSGDISVETTGDEITGEDDSVDELAAEDLLAEQPASTAEGATAVDAAAIYEPICYKLDLIILILIVFFAAYMFKGLANPYKLGGKHIGKSR